MCKGEASDEGHTTRWEEFYAEDERVLSAEPSISVRRAASVFLLRKKLCVLDVGCGVGRDSMLLAKQGLSVTGVEVSELGIHLARNRTTGGDRSNPTFIQADARSLPFQSGLFGGVYCFGLLHEFVGPGAEMDVADVMTEIHRVLRPQGLLVLTVLAGQPDDGLPHVRLFPEQMFDEATEAFRGLDKVQIADIGCTGRDNYKIWYGVFERP